MGVLLEAGAHREATDNVSGHRKYERGWKRGGRLWESRNARRRRDVGVSGRMLRDGKVVTGERKTLWRSFLETINVRFGSVGAGVVSSMPACRSVGVASAGVWREFPRERAAWCLGCNVVSVFARIAGFEEWDLQRILL